MPDLYDISLHIGIQKLSSDTIVNTMLQTVSRGDYHESSELAIALVPLMFHGGSSVSVEHSV